jgi:hypothetical protein
MAMTKAQSTKMVRLENELLRAERRIVMLLAEKTLYGRMTEILCERYSVGDDLRDEIRKLALME